MLKTGNLDIQKTELSGVTDRSQWRICA